MQTEGMMRSPDKGDHLLDGVEEEEIGLNKHYGINSESNGQAGGIGHSTFML